MVQVTFSKALNYPSVVISTNDAYGVGTGFSHEFEVMENPEHRKSIGGLSGEVYDGLKKQQVTAEDGVAAFPRSLALAGASLKRESNMGLFDFAQEIDRGLENSLEQARNYLNTAI